jgi:hypothetical protein
MYHKTQKMRSQSSICSRCNIKTSFMYSCTHLQLLPMLRRSWAIPLRALYAFTALGGTYVFMWRRQEVAQCKQAETILYVCNTATRSCVTVKLSLVWITGCFPSKFSTYVLFWYFEKEQNENVYFQMSWLLCNSKQC